MSEINDPSMTQEPRFLTITRESLVDVSGKLDDFMADVRRLVARCQEAELQRDRALAGLNEIGRYVQKTRESGVAPNVETYLGAIASMISWGEEVLAKFRKRERQAGMVLVHKAVKIWCEQEPDPGAYSRLLAAVDEELGRLAELEKTNQAAEAAKY